MRPDKRATHAADATVAPSRGTSRFTKREVVPKRASESSEMMHIRVERALKRDATATLEAIGLSLSDAVRLFLNRVVIEQALPLQLRVPNATTRAAIESARALGAGDFATAEELFDALEEAGGR